MALRVDQVTNFKVTELPDNPSLIYFDFTDTNGNLTRIEVQLAVKSLEELKDLTMLTKWTKFKKGIDLADSFMRLSKHHELHPPGRY